MCHRRTTLSGYYVNLQSLIEPFYNTIFINYLPLLEIPPSCTKPFNYDVEIGILWKTMVYRIWLRDEKSNFQFVHCLFYWYVPNSLFQAAPKCSSQISNTTRCHLTSSSSHHVWCFGGFFHPAALKMDETEITKWGKAGVNFLCVKHCWRKIYFMPDISAK